MVATATPGIKDILILGKVKQLERSGKVDLILLDAPAAGHAITFLRSARGVLDAVRIGPIHAQAAEVLELLNDERRCQVVLVTLPEETPVNELVDTAYSLEDEVGVKLGPVVVNGLYPFFGELTLDPEAAAGAVGAALRPGEAEALGEAASFRLARHELQAEQVTRLADALPLPQIHLPFLFTPALGPVEVTALARAALDGVSALHVVPSPPQPTLDEPAPEPAP